MVCIVDHVDDVLDLISKLEHQDQPTMAVLFDDSKNRIMIGELMEQYHAVCSINYLYLTVRLSTTVVCQHLSV